MGLYDNYRLSNSTVIPQYVGAPIAELSKLYEYNQNRYDLASQADAQMADNVLNTPVLDKDKGTWKGINDQVQQEFRDRVAKGDYENLYGIVQQRARAVAPKIKALVEQVKAEHDYETLLNSKDLGLTQDQKATYMQMANDAYKGIKFDEQGRAIGGFRGMTPVKNVDVNELIRKHLSIMTANGKEVRRGGDTGWEKWTEEHGWESISPQDITKVFNYARQNDKDWQAHNEQDLMLKQYAANRGVDDNVAMQSINALPDTITSTDNKGKAVKVPNNIKTKLLTEIKTGKSPSAVMQKYNNDTLASQQYESQLGYALGKAYSKTKDKKETGVSDLYIATQLEDYKRQQDKLEDTEVVEGTVTDPSGDYKDWDSFQKDVRETDGAIDQTQTVITAQKQSIAKSLGITPDKLTDAQITAYFTKNKQPEAQAAYEDRVASLKNLQQRKANQQSIMGSLENDVLGTGEFGYTTSTARRTAEKDAVSKILLEKPNSNVRVNVGNFTRADQKVGSDGKPLSANWKVMTRAQLVEKLKDAKIVATDKSWGINQIRFQLPDGRYVSLQDNAVTGKIDDIVSELGNKGKKLEQAKIDWFNKNHSNYAQPQSIQILSKKRSEQSKQEIMAAGTTNIQTIAGTPVEDEKVAMAIAGGNFQYIGRTKGNGRQNTGGIIAIIDPETKQVTGQYKVNYNTTSALPNAENLMKVGKKRNDASIYNTGMEMMPGNQVQAFDQKHVANVIIKDGRGNIIAKVEKTRPGGQTTIRIRDANGNRITTIPETSIDAKAFIQHQLENGATIEGLDN